MTKRSLYTPTHQVRGKEFLDVSLNRFRAVLVLFSWSVVLAGISFIFIFFPATTAAAPFNSETFVLSGEHVFLLTGLLLSALIAWYLAVLVKQVFFRGPVYRVSKEGLWLNQAGRFFIPRNTIYSVFLTYNQGMATSVVLELKDRTLLNNLADRLPKFAAITCKPKEGSLSLALGGLKNKDKFIGTLARLSLHQSQHISTR